MTRFQLILPVDSDNVTKIRTGHKMHVEGPQICQLYRWNNSFQNMYSMNRQQLTVWPGIMILCQKHFIFAYFGGHESELPDFEQGCIIRSILSSGMGARGVSSEHVENMEMYSCSPTQVRSDSQRTLLLRLLEILIACLFKGSQEQSFFLQTLLFMAFLVTVLKILTYALVST